MGQLKEYHLIKMCSVATSAALPPPRLAPSSLAVPTQVDENEEDVEVVTKKRRTSNGSRWDAKPAEPTSTLELRKQAVRDAVAAAQQAFRFPSYVVVVASDMATALRALLEISTTAWKDTDGDPAPPHDEITERARLEFVHAMLASNIVPPPA
ncbi:hypothetical protein DYB37_009117 [Aphanomyces astaci]|uniref:Uncharacterized protein n=1 Tax=Aphanomyces astaci TaxID=112090 RepID=A0A3L6VI48_APHAT|nr:hypothetical protein DYB35_009695 [Aphanomyces astaci]RHZ14767.1 hypothetical protein DYB37_009117 [Aphanomyces astaci]RHZ30924.1 hypothetical protein DYB26_010005 [Aphanomyces astaci]RLO08406.1 hypothetical protein DYB28_001626 [Aphanomyces astaci]